MRGLLLAGAFCLAGRGVDGALVPKMSERMTDTADSTNSHSTARKPSLIRVRVSSDITSLPSCG